MNGSVQAMMLLLIALASPAPSSQARAIHVVANEFAFVAPETARAGPTTFTLQNRGEKFHELFIALLRPGTTGAQIAAAHQKQGTPFRQLGGVYLDGDVSVALFAGPGATSPARVSIDLLPGRDYVLLCQLRDSVPGPQHAGLGMFRILHVK